jgi:hypothetical protein
MLMNCIASIEEKKFKLKIIDKTIFEIHMSEESLNDLGILCIDMLKHIDFFFLQN